MSLFYVYSTTLWHCHLCVSAGSVKPGSSPSGSQIKIMIKLNSCIKIVWTKHSLCLYRIPVAPSVQTARTPQAYKQVHNVVDQTVSWNVMFSLTMETLALPACRFQALLACQLCLSTIVCLLAYLLACLIAGLPSCLPACCVRACLSARLPACCLHACLIACMRV